MTNAIEKGGLKNPEDAKLHLGIAYLGGGRLPEAKAVLNKIGGADGTKDLAKMWLIQRVAQ